MPRLKNNKKLWKLNFVKTENFFITFSPLLLMLLLVLWRRRRLVDSKLWTSSKVSFSISLHLLQDIRLISVPYPTTNGIRHPVQQQNLKRQPTYDEQPPTCPWSSLVEGDEGCFGSNGKLMRLWETKNIYSTCTFTFHTVGTIQSFIFCLAGLDLDVLQALKLTTYLLIWFNPN